MRVNQEIKHNKYFQEHKLLVHANGSEMFTVLVVWTQHTKHVMPRWPHIKAKTEA